MVPHPHDFLMQIWKKIVEAQKNFIKKKFKKNSNKKKIRGQTILLAVRRQSVKNSTPHTTIILKAFIYIDTIMQYIT